jgi:hypothetical protein
MGVRTRLRPDEHDAGARAGGRPILLATLGTRLDEGASAFAVDSAVETGQPLIVANVTALEPLAMSVILGYDALEEFTPEVSDSVRRPAELARSLGVAVERLRVRSPRPITALVQLAAERRPGVVVFGSDRSALAPRRYRRAVEALRAGAGCAVWVPPALG